MPQQEYAGAYEKARVALQAEVRLPALGPVRLVESGGKKRDVELVGFGPGCAFLRRKAGDEPSRVPREKIASLTDAAGVGIGPAAIDTWTSSGRLPLMDVLAMNGAPLDATAAPLTKENKDRNLDQRQVVRLPLAEIVTVTWHPAGREHDEGVPHRSGGGRRRDRRRRHRGGRRRRRQ